MAVVAGVGYFAASLAYIVDFVTRRDVAGRVGSWLLYLTLAIHTAWLVVAHVELGYFPITDAYHALSFVAWGSAAAYVVIELRLDRRGFGPFVLPVVLLFQVVAAAFLVARPRPGPLNEIFRSAWFEIHAGTALFSYCAFAMAFAAGLMYLLLVHEIRLKRLGFFFTRMPPLEVLERINYQAVALGFLCLTIGIGSGIVWSLDVFGARALIDSKEVSALIVWLLYAANIHARWRMGWRGRRTATFSVVNFVLLFAVFCLTSFVLGAHQFQEL